MARNLARHADRESASRRGIGPADCPSRPGVRPEPDGPAEPGAGLGADTALEADGSARYRAHAARKATTNSQLGRDTPESFSLMVERA
jgi:hypothetical protein